jgi:probable H4MPT-linked C1 transfer pathway protein
LLYHGWDIGGAHVKYALVDGDGRVLTVEQRTCALWQGLDALVAVLAELAPSPDLAVARHAVTMTGELCDLFATRAEGVVAILGVLKRYLGEDLAVFSRNGFLSPAAACAEPEAVGSMNWRATALDCAQVAGTGVLLDIGSTTTDIVPFAEGAVCARADRDGTRLACGELVYTGICRTPVMAVATQAPFAGAWRGLAAEYFANMADVYRVTGDLPEAADDFPTADQRPADVPHSRARLARMLGEDASNLDHGALDGFAEHLIQCQLQRIEQGLAQVASAASGRLSGMLLVGAGVGSFLASRIAARCGGHFTDYASLCGAPARAAVNISAPAVAVARLRGRHTA